MVFFLQNDVCNLRQNGMTANLMMFHVSLYNSYNVVQGGYNHPHSTCLKIRAGTVYTCKRVNVKLVVNVYKFHHTVKRCHVQPDLFLSFLALFFPCFASIFHQNHPPFMIKSKIQTLKLIIVPYSRSYDSYLFIISLIHPSENSVFRIQQPHARFHSGAPELRGGISI